MRPLSMGLATAPASPAAPLGTAPSHLRQACEPALLCAVSTSPAIAQDRHRDVDATRQPTAATPLQLLLPTCLLVAFLPPFWQ